MEKIQALWAKFKVQISFVAGCLVVATSMGTCSFDPSATSEEATTETTTETVETTTDSTSTTTDSVETSTTTEATTGQTDAATTTEVTE